MCADVTRDELPTGVVTFLMSDVEGSGGHWVSDHHQMTIAVRDLDSVIAKVSEAHSGVVLKARGEGDSHFVVFERPSAAVAAACELQSVTSARPLGRLELRVRIGVHAGEADPSADDYYGIAVNQTARLREVAHGGQTVVSHVVAALARTSLAGKVQLKSLGHHRLRDFPKLEEIFQATTPGADDVFPPLRTGESRAPAIMAIAVVDVSGSSDRVAVSHSNDVIDWQRRLSIVLRRAAEPREPAVLKLLGDGCLAAFDDPVIALAFVRDMQAAFAELDLQVHSGIEIGRVELYDGDVVGPAAFVASELCRLAAPGQIIGTRNVVDLAGASSGAVSLGGSTLRATGKDTELFAL
jgi:class 3 adenylate cyclase